MVSINKQGNKSRELDVLINKKELLSKARKRKLNLGMIEKDYVLGWLLFGFSGVEMVFKGGTALSKIYFPKIWRLSEDLDFSMPKGDFKNIDIEEILKRVSKESGIGFSLKNRYENPEYLQLKIQYQALLGKNWGKIDITRESILDEPVLKILPKAYSDYPSFKARVMSLEEIFSEKLRALIERDKTRDYYDVWKMLSLKVDLKKVKKIFLQKCEAKGIDFSLNKMFPDNLEGILKPYWERELSRLVYSRPDLKKVMKEIKDGLKFLG
ncbi:MAG: hypothetical protein CO092_03105 [Candidatus Aenigmarchaeota archaeon CG_4_9_14_3_um_filter_37_18]|nr:MAG: hypothetical protein COS07_03900 [Candidatus Aenigmarchaeota archaeon CG01_land_8_20_14_3_00_37_9]PJB74999.1 MAG: hypothetical protein CO092_03105 [Candidatus Aenigmarchaeota archaeon CG_4_9_14_3_um_filter_37_18]